MPTAASLRLAQTRLEMAVWLHQEAAARSQTPGGGAPASSPLAMLAGLALNAAGHRLQHGGTAAHPPAAPALLGLACGTAQAALRPVAVRHPWALVAVAAGGGAALVASRPWRWLLHPAVLGRLASHLAPPLIAAVLARASLAAATQPQTGQEPPDLR